MKTFSLVIGSDISYESSFSLWCWGRSREGGGGHLVKLPKLKNMKHCTQTNLASVSQNLISEDLNFKNVPGEECPCTLKWDCLCQSVSWTPVSAPVMLWVATVIVIIALVLVMTLNWNALYQKILFNIFINGPEGSSVPKNLIVVLGRAEDNTLRFKGNLIIYYYSFPEEQF